MKVKNKTGGLVKVGVIHSLVDDRIILSSVEKIILDIDNILLTKDRLIVGIVEDVFG